MNALEELAALNDLVSQELRLALKNCEALDQLSADARQTAYKARKAVCRSCPHPKQFVVEYHLPGEGRVCRLCGLHESGGCWYKHLNTISYSEGSSQRVPFNTAMSYRTLRADEI